MNRKVFAQHLEKELPALVADGVIDEAAAARLRARYGQEAARTNLLTAALAALGALFIGGGIILLIAHNWSEFPRAARAAISFLPLVVSIALAAFVLATGRNSAAWREGVGIFYALSAGASIALVSQTYNIQGSGESFLLAWALFALPLVYLLDSAGAAVVWLGVVFAWFIARLFLGAPWGWFALAAAFLPWLVWRHAGRQDLPSTVLVLWAAVLSLFVTPTPLLAGVGGTWSITGLAGFFAALYLAGEAVSDHRPSPWKNPALTLGRLASLLLLLVLTYPAVWRLIIQERGIKQNWSAIGWAFLALYAAGWGASAFLEWSRGARRSLLLGGMPVVVLLVGFAGSSIGTRASSLVIVLYGLAVGVDHLRRSVVTRSLADLNLGMGLIAVMATLRFFDSDLGILARGIAFIVIGAAFLAVNAVLARRWRRRAEP